MTPPAQSGNAASELASLLQGAGISRLDDTGWIRVTGEDRVRWLNGMVTNSIQQMNPGEGTYNFLLSVQGRIQGDANIFAQPESLLIETSATQLLPMMALLDRYIIMDDVELTDISAEPSGLLIAGPHAARLLEKIGLTITAEPGTLEIRATLWHDSEVRIIHAHSPLVPRFELWADHVIADDLFAALQREGASTCTPESLEWLRILEGTPAFAIDIRDRELPQETAQTRALHFAKGCYLGQEIVERIRSRGNVHRTFSGFRLEGELPPAGAILEADGKPIGELTTVATIPLPNAQPTSTHFALGYVRREALERGTPLLYPGGTASPVSLPFLSVAASELHAASESSERV
jgi:folate-binding protein YgfZ